MTSVLFCYWFCYLGHVNFADLRVMVRRDIIADRFDDAVHDATDPAGPGYDLNSVLWQASVELAAALDLPRQVVTAAVAINALSIPLPGIRNVISLSINGDDAQSADLQVLYRMRPLGPRPVRYYNFDLRRGSEVLISPPSQGGTAVIEVSPVLERPDALDFDTAEPWLGVLAEFHHVIAYRAGLVLYQMDERQEESQWLLTEFQNRMGELAAVLGRTDIPNLMIPAESRDDQGARG